MCASWPCFRVGLLALTVLASRLTAEIGIVDPTFDIGSSLRGYVSQLAVQDDGRILIGGDFTIFQGFTRKGLARLHPDGTLDATFDAKLSQGIHSLAVQHGGGVLVYLANDQSVTRLLPDGSNDPGFSPIAVLMPKILVLPDDRFLVSGSRMKANEFSYVAFFERFKADGMPDSGFADSVLKFSDNWVGDFALQEDGKLVVAGRLLTSWPPRSCARLNFDGSIDPTFESDRIEGEATAVVTHPDGRVTVGGWLSFDGQNVSLVQFRADGQVDDRFRPAIASPIDDLAVDAEGRILLATSSYVLQGQVKGIDWTDGVVRLFSDGTRDWTFNVFIGAARDGQFFGGYGGGPRVHSIVAQADGQVLAGGLFSHVDGRQQVGAVRLKEAGIATAFYVGGGDVDEAAGEAKVTVYRAGPGNDVARVEFFTRDASAIDGLDYRGMQQTVLFGPGESAREIPITVLNNTNVAANAATEFEIALADPGIGTALGFPQSTFVRIRDDDHLIELIPGEVRVDELGRTAELMVRRHGPVLFQGQIEIDYQVIPESAAAGEDFVLASGHISFHGTYGPHELPPAVIPIRAKICDDATDESDEDFRILLSDLRPIGVSGSVHLGNASARVTIQDNDEPECPGPGTDDLVTLAVSQTDGRILIGGYFHTVNGAPRTALARLQAELSLDPTFDPGTGPAPGPGNLETIAPLPDGTVLVGGSFDSFNGAPRQCIARLNSDGSVDLSLDVGSSTPSGDYHQARVRVLVPLMDNRFFAGGAFRSFADVERPCVARFEATGAVDREVLRRPSAIVSRSSISGATTGWKTPGPGAQRRWSLHSPAAAGRRFARSRVQPWHPARFWFRVAGRYWDLSGWRDSGSRTLAPHARQFGRSDARGDPEPIRDDPVEHPAARPPHSDLWPCSRLLEYAA